MVAEKRIDKETSQLRNYEMVLVINPEATEDVVNATLETVRQLVTAHGGEVSAVEPWGKRRLAYPIKRFSEGNYVLTKLQIKPTIGKELEANLRISENILRYLLVKLENQ